ncbi:MULTISPECIES: hypothetical protein [unclassified Lentimonas]|nr:MULTISPECIES: hypothetical protein [unclassified Lentimonas]CAA6697678.1 Unannotated [Lentimonas sp. CC19]CAA6697782.1 Unannotated [Lentimonas sp. CC10]
METETEMWYQSGHWPLVGAIAMLMITNAFAFWKIYAQANASLKAQVRLRKIEGLKEQISQFYNPLATYLTLNKKLFEALGPHTFPENEHKRNAAGETWNRIKNECILPNNCEIKDILRTRIHLLAELDSPLMYTELYNHISMYDIFQDMMCPEKTGHGILLPRGSYYEKATLHCGVQTRGS